MEPEPAGWVLVAFAAVETEVAGPEVVLIAFGLAIFVVFAFVAVAGSRYLPGCSRPAENLLYVRAVDPGVRHVVGKTCDSFRNAMAYLISLR